ncbi:helix-turn-helix domain-containing protein [Aestuariivirga sp.]|jgi:transcriptional regulator with XRE-family HTH domain|uniref:helix-turn-helix domain-containing protein n=1 Tax=Aestuariivirga sp. TaxID=2650926 RepID=UPI00378427A0
MTPFGEKMRKLRMERGVTLKQMADEIGVSSAYLSALEHGKRGRPGWHLIQRILSFFNIIWDEAEEVIRLARISHPRITIDTSGLNPKATELANRLADEIARLEAATLDEILVIIERRRSKTLAAGSPSDAARRRRSVRTG